MSKFDLFRNYIFGNSIRDLARMTGKTRNQISYITENYLKKPPNVEMFQNFRPNNKDNWGPKSIIMVDTIWQPIRGENKKDKSIVCNMRFKKRLCYKVKEYWSRLSILYGTLIQKVSF